MVDPIRAKLDVLAQWGDFVGPVSELVDALRAVLDLCRNESREDAWHGGVDSIQIEVVRRVIAEHLGVTDV